LAFGIIAHCYYDNGVIGKKFEFVLKFILGTRDLFKKVKSIDSPLQISGDPYDVPEVIILSSNSSSKGEIAKVNQVEYIEENKVESVEEKNKS
jgi:hypothetical protein